MTDTAHKPRVALLGARETDVELLAELQRQDRVSLVAVYDPDPHAPGLALAEIAGVPAGADAVARERLAEAEVIVLPSNRVSMQTAIDWCSGLRAELVGIEAARQRWGGAPGGTSPAEAPARDLETELATLDTATARLLSMEELGEWLLDASMRAVGASGGSLQLLAADTSELYLLAARGLSEHVLQHARHPLGEPVSGLAAAMRTIQILHGEQAGRSPSQRGPVQSALSIPLLTPNDTLVGVLNVSTTVPGRRFGADAVALLERSAPRLATLLQRAGSVSAATWKPEDEIFARLVDVEREGAPLPSALADLSDSLCQLFAADALSLHVAAEDGDWVMMAETGGRGGPGRRRADLERAFLQRQCLHVPDSTLPHAASEALDSVDAAVERALSPAAESTSSGSWVYAPLAGTTLSGVVAAHFQRLASAERFVHHGRAAVRNLAFYVETHVRASRAAAQQARSARLQRLVLALLEAPEGEREALLVREAALLVAAEHAVLRHVDEARRTYSRPIAHGIPAANSDAWRALDARVTEHTLQTRRTEVRTTQPAASDRAEDGVRSRSLVSVPILRAERIVAVLNVYDKLPQDPLDGHAFTSFDRELLASLGAIAACLLAPPASPAAVAAPAPDAETALERESRRLREELQREIARSRRHQRELGLCILQVHGLNDLEETVRSDVRSAIDRILREYVRSSDLVGWYGPDRLLVVSPEADARGRELEARARQIVLDKLPPRLRPQLRLGTSHFPADGEEATTLLPAAVARLA